VDAQKNEKRDKSILENENDKHFKKLEFTKVTFFMGPGKYSFVVRHRVSVSESCIISDNIVIYICYDYECAHGGFRALQNIAKTVLPNSLFPETTSFDRQGNGGAPFLLGKSAVASPCSAHRPYLCI
jgi:hypothetical protein